MQAAKKDEVQALYVQTAAHIQPTLGQASDIALLVMVVLGVVLNFSSMIALVSSLGLLAGVIFVVAALVIGYLLGGSGRDMKSVLGLGTARRNVWAALVVAGQIFDPDVVVYLLVIAVIGLVILMPAAGELGKRSRATDNKAQ